MYKEIFKLKNMLEKAKIPFEFRTYSNGYQIGYPELPPSKNRVCSVVEHDYSYGHEDDLLEILGLLTKREQKDDSVLGFLTARKVFNRIKKHYEEVNNDEFKKDPKRKRDHIDDIVGAFRR